MLSARVKKLLLSAAVILTYISYSYHQRHDGSGLVIPPSNLNPTPSSGSSPSATAPATPASTPAPTTTPGALYRDGSYTGSTADAYYGYVQVKAVIAGGKITDVQFLQYPNDRANSIRINSQAMPYLTQEAIQAQSAQVDIISGATDTSQAFIQSLSSALAHARS